MAKKKCESGACPRPAAVAVKEQADRVTAYTLKAAPKQGVRQLCSACGLAVVSAEVPRLGGEA